VASHHQVRGHNGGPGTRELVGEIGSQLVQLAQAEVELARAELVSSVRSARRALVGLGVATVAALVTTLLGVAGALVGGFVGHVFGWYGPNDPVGFIMAVLGAVVLLVAYRMIARGPRRA
jgi:uncharacterized membrane protein YeaQ/YmgE (transglycosylase-associated protein family)